MSMSCVSRLKSEELKILFTHVQTFKGQVSNTKVIRQRLTKRDPLGSKWKHWTTEITRDNWFKEPKNICSNGSMESIKERKLRKLFKREEKVRKN
jgi:hypothetical protein